MAEGWNVQFQPPGQNLMLRPFETAAQSNVGHGAEQLVLGGGPGPDCPPARRRDFEVPAALENGPFTASQTPGQFQIRQRAEQSDFARGPLARWQAQLDTPAFTFRDDFLEGASDSPGQGGVGLFAKLFYFGSCPRRTAMGFDSAFSDRHGS